MGIEIIRQPQREYAGGWIGVEDVALSGWVSMISYCYVLLQVAVGEGDECCGRKMALHSISAGETPPAEQKHAPAFHPAAS